MNRTNVNKYGFKVGDKFKVIKEEGFMLGETVTFTGDDGTDCPGFTDIDGRERCEYYSYLELIVETPKTPVEIAQENLTKAKAEMSIAINTMDEAKKSEEDAQEFTDADVETFMVVDRGNSLYETQLRLVVIGGDLVLFLDKQGRTCKTCSRLEIIKELNSMYRKTTLTLKDFANA